MTPRWRRRVVWAVLCWAAVCGFALLVRARPNPLLVAAGVFATALTLWGVADLAADVDPAGWGRDDERVLSRRGNDPRASTLNRMLHDRDHPLDLVERVRPMLVELVDERLDTRYGVDRLDHAAAARTLLGDDLLDFAAGGGPPGGDQAAYLARLLQRAEAI